MDRDEAAAIIHRMMRQLEEETGPKGAPCCDGCGRRGEPAPYCADCRMQAMVEIVEESDF